HLIRNKAKAQGAKPKAKHFCICFRLLAFSFQLFVGIKVLGGFYSLYGKIFVLCMSKPRNYE
ncbi:MAG TPA: hypothetical protein VIM79_15785, partial [Niastella sp.]